MYVIWSLLLDSMEETKISVYIFSLPVTPKIKPFPNPIEAKGFLSKKLQRTAVRSPKPTKLVTGLLGVDHMIKIVSINLSFFSPGFGPCVTQ